MNVYIEGAANDSVRLISDAVYSNNKIYYYYYDYDNNDNILIYVLL